MFKHAALTLALLILPAHPAFAQTNARANHLQSIKPAPAGDPEFHDPTNAALLYYRAFMSLSEDMNQKINDAITTDNPNWAPDVEVSKILIDHQDYAYALMRAAKLESCDFGIEYSQGFSALLPHLVKMRSAARFLAADARRLIIADQPSDAADRIAAMFVMSRHLTGERLLISSLVSSAIHNLAVAQTDYLINSGRLTADGKHKLLEAMDRFNVPDPFGIKAALRGERYCVTVWIRNQIAGPDGAKVVTEQIMPMLDGNPDSEDAKAVKAMDVNAINADLDKAEPFYTAILEVFDLPDARDRLAALEKKIQDGDYGIIARHAAPAMSKAHEQYDKANTRQSEARARLANAFAQ